MQPKKSIIKPGAFGHSAACDIRRQVFDAHNEQILASEQVVECLFLGDSITEMWDVHLWFEAMGYIVNRGIGGDITEHILRRSEADAFQLSPKKLVYLAGVNDLLGTCPDLWWRREGSDPSEVLSKAEQNIVAMMKRCAEAGIDGYFCSVLPTDFCVPYNGFGLEKMILTLNEKIKNACDSLGMTYVDYYSALCDETGMHIRDGLTYDGVHPTAAGYAIMAEVLKQQL